MKFAIATNDGYQGVLEALLKCGWKLEKLFVSPPSWLCDNKQVIARALELGASVQNSPIGVQDLVELGKRECSALIVASYQWKVPKWSPYLKYAINFHPSPLPEARGPYPLVRAIVEDRNSWAVTCHKINDKFDRGEILDSEKFLLSPNENHETLDLKVQLAAIKLANRIAVNLDSFWTNATAQIDGSYWSKWSEQDRTIDFNQPVEEIMRRVRAFGNIECIAIINSTRIFTHQVSAWQEAHSSQPGTVIHSTKLTMVVAASNGYVAITEWSLLEPGTIMSKTRS